MKTYKNIEKNLQELMIIGFEYSTYSPLCIDLNDFINILPKKINTYIKKNTNIENNDYLKPIITNSSYNKFYSTLLLLTKLKIKIKKSQFTQLLNYIGVVDKNINNCIMFSNLINGFIINHYIYSCFSARNSILSTGLATADIGYLMRKLTECLRSVYIKESLCGSVFKIKFEKTLTHTNKIYNIKYIYSPFLCYSLKNLCSNCFFINIKKKNITGYNKGIISSQSICEPRLQSALRTFHVGCLKTNINSTLIKIYKKNSKINKIYLLKKKIDCLLIKKKSIIFNNKKIIHKNNIDIKKPIKNNKIIEYKNINLSSLINYNIKNKNKQENYKKLYSIV